jgi:D-3-phosphoglycerate dehydrogenase / 2-oxoglutarate reductase
LVWRHPSRSTLHRLSTSKPPTAGQTGQTQHRHRRQIQPRSGWIAGGFYEHADDHGRLTPDLASRLTGLRVRDEPESPDAVVERLRGATVAINGHTPMPQALLRRCQGLKSIVFLGSGASSYIDVDAAAALGIVMRTVMGYGDRTVAEHAMALMLAASRRVVEMDRALRADRWEPLEGIDLAGKRLGVIGTGGIGTTFMRMAEAFGMDVATWNRSAGSTPLVRLEELLETSDVVSLHLALTAETRGFLDASRLARLRPGAILINTARGALIDEAALIAALTEGRLRHAALDVFVDEPLPHGHPLTRLNNVTLKSHAGYKTPEASRRLLAMGIDLAACDLLAFGGGSV